MSNLVVKNEEYWWGFLNNSQMSSSYDEAYFMETDEKMVIEKLDDGRIMVAVDGTWKTENGEQLLTAADKNGRRRKLEKKK